MARAMPDRHTEVSQNYGYLFRDPHDKDFSILGSILGSPYLGKLPYLLLWQKGSRKRRFLLTVQAALAVRHYQGGPCPV